jgi:hypothetical protein
VKVAAGITRTHKPFGEDYRASCLRENLTSSSYGEGLETGLESFQEPRQSFTRQLFFKWIKQHLRIKSFFGISENAVKTQIWIAVSVYVLVAILKKELKLDKSLYEILQVLSISLFENSPILLALTASHEQMKINHLYNQLQLFKS